MKLVEDVAARRSEYEEYYAVLGELMDRADDFMDESFETAETSLVMFLDDFAAIKSKVRNSDLAKVESKVCEFL